MIDFVTPVRIRGLYAITPDTSNTVQLCEMVDHVLLGGARLVQYRNKAADCQLRLIQSSAISRLCKSYGVPLIINDHLDLALEIDADGLHVGRDDISVMEARRVMGKEKLIGVSCYNQLNLALSAEKAGANYVAFGAFFPSITKTDAARASISLLDEAKRKLSVPVVAIGGINLGNADELTMNGCDAIAVSHGLFNAHDLKLTAYYFSRLF